VTSHFLTPVDVLAPGVNILTTYLRNKTATVSGTSFSAPHVSGAVAFYLAQNPEHTPSQVSTAIKLMADTEDPQNPDVEVPYPNTTKRSVYLRTS